jgi:hypothetical protein
VKTVHAARKQVGLVLDVARPKRQASGFLVIDRAKWVLAKQAARYCAAKDWP